MFHTLAYHTTVSYRDFTAYTSARLQQLGLNFGSLFLVIYVGKHPNCTQAELTGALGLDWGYSQRSITKLVEDGFMTRRKLGRAYHLALSPLGEQAFQISHQVFFDWDEERLAPLSPGEREELLRLLEKMSLKKGEHPSCTKP